jgi:hypothetical protein
MISELVAYLCAAAGFACIAFAFLVAYLDWVLKNRMEKRASAAASPPSTREPEGGLVAVQLNPADYINALAELTANLSKGSEAVAGLTVGVICFGMAVAIALADTLD